MKNIGKRILGGVILAAAISILPQGVVKGAPVVLPDGVMGQSLKDENYFNDPMEALECIMAQKLGRSAAVSFLKASPYDDAFTAATFVTEEKYVSGPLYHDKKYENHVLLNGVDVSWWQGGGRNSTKINVDWKKAHEDGIDFAFVRAASRDSADGTIYTDTCADAHIKAALANDVSVGLYIFSQALNEKEAKEEARYVLNLVETYNWNITLPIVIDRENGSYGRLKGGMLTTEEETAICKAFAKTVQKEGYQAMAYASLNWVNDYWDTEALKKAGCDIWLARYNNATTSYNIPKYGVTTPYEDVLFDYSFWQYSSSGTVDGYNSRMDTNIWYKDTNIPVNDLCMTDNTTETISLQWEEIPHVSGYRLYRYDEEQEKYTLVADVSDNFYVDSGLVAGESYTYRVRGYWTIGGTTYYGRYSDVCDAVTVPDRVASIETEKVTDNSITLTWDEVYGASGYRLYQYQKKDKKYRKLLDIEGGDITTHQVAGLLDASSYRFKVKAYFEKEDVIFWGESSEAYEETTKPGKVADFRAETGTPTKIRLNWTEIQGASGYQIYRLDSEEDTYRKIATIEDSSVISYTDISLKSAKKYVYKVRAYLNFGGRKYYGKYSAVSEAVTKPAKAGSVTLKAKKGKMAVSWEAMEGVSGYVLYRYDENKKKYVKLATLEGEATISYQDKSVQKGESYSYKMRAFIRHGEEIYYGGYSAVVEKSAK